MNIPDLKKIGFNKICSNIHLHCNNRDSNHTNEYITIVNLWGAL